MNTALKILQGLINLSLALATHLERKDLMDAGKNKELVWQLSMASGLVEEALAARRSVQPGDMSDDGHKRED